LRKVPVISIVDDDESVREATTGLVRSFGYVVATFASAEEFLQSDRVRDTSCLISDIQMPGLSGFELQDRLNAAGHRVPIIFITAFPEEQKEPRRREFRALGHSSLMLMSMVRAPRAVEQVQVHYHNTRPAFEQMRPKR
jgi:CheY-like chemotaxis protein